VFLLLLPFIALSLPCILFSRGFFRPEFYEHFSSPIWSFLSP
jgi:hypothetical protein